MRYSDRKGCRYQPAAGASSANMPQLQPLADRPQLQAGLHAMRILPELFRLLLRTNSESRQNHQELRHSFQSAGTADSEILGSAASSGSRARSSTLRARPVRGSADRSRKHTQRLLAEGIVSSSTSSSET